MKKLNITFCSFPDYAGNAKALYEYMRDKYDFHYTWIVYNEKSVEVLRKSGVHAILIGTDEFKKYISKTDVFFTTHANLAGDKIKTKKGIYIELWHGIGPKPLGFLTNNPTKKDYDWYSFLSETLDYVIVPNEFWRVIFSSFFNMKPERILPLGFPMQREIMLSNGKENLANLLDVDLSKYSKIIYYMPTFKKGCGRGVEANINADNILNLKPYDEEMFLKYLNDNDILLVVKRHPSDECEYKIIGNDNIKNIDDVMLFTKGYNINNILNAADILITDYSSLCLEFSMLGRPSVYLTTDAMEYMNNRGIIFGNFDFWTDKFKCDNIDMLLKYLDTLINEKNKNYNLNNKIMYNNNDDDGGCARICNFLFDGNKINKGVKRYNSELFKLRDLTQKQKNIIEEDNKEIEKLKQELYEVYNSKGWQMLEKLRSVKTTFKKK